MNPVRRDCFAMPKASSSVPSSKNPNPNSIGVRRTRDDDVADLDRAAVEEGAELRRIRWASGATLERVGELSDTNISTLSLAERGLERLTPARRAVVLQVLRAEIRKHAAEVNALLAAGLERCE